MHQKNAVLMLLIALIKLTLYMNQRMTLSIKSKMPLGITQNDSLRTVG